MHSTRTFARLVAGVAMLAILSACAAIPPPPRITPPGQSVYLGDHPWDVKAD